MLNEFTNTEHRTPSTERQHVIDNVNRYNTLFAAQPQSVSAVFDEYFIAVYALLFDR